MSATTNGNIETSKINNASVPLALPEAHPRAVSQITGAEWKKTHRDFKSVIDGQRYVLRLTERGTALVPVELVKE